MSEPDKSSLGRDAEWRTQDGEVAESRQASPEDDGRSDHRTMVLLTWALLLAGLFTFVAGIAAVIVAYAKRGDAGAPWRSHYDKAVQIFWIWLLLTLIGAPLTLVLVGYVVLAIAAIWTAAAGVVGLIRASENRPY